MLKQASCSGRTRMILVTRVDSERAPMNDPSHRREIKLSRVEGRPNDNPIYRSNRPSEIATLRMTAFGEFETVAVRSSSARNESMSCHSRTLWHFIGAAEPASAMTTAQHAAQFFEPAVGGGSGVALLPT